MKNYRIKALVAGLAMLAFLVVSFAVAPPVSAAAIPKDLTLKVTKNENETGKIPAQTFTVKIHLIPDVPTNANYFTIWGYVINKPVFIGGTGILDSVSGFITMNLTATQIHTGTGTDGVQKWHDTGIMQVRYNPTTNTGGIFYEVGHDFSPVTKQFDARYSAGTVKK